MCVRALLSSSHFPLPLLTPLSRFRFPSPLSTFRVPPSLLTSFLSTPGFHFHFLSPFHFHSTLPFLSFPAYASFSTQLHPSPSFRHLTLPSMSPYACLSHQSWSERSVVGDRRSARLRCRHLLLCFHLSASCGSAKRLIPMSTPLAARDHSPPLPFLFHSTFPSPFYLTSPSPHLPLRCSVSAALGPPSVRSQ